MKLKNLVIPLAIASLLATSGCVTTGMGNKETIGAGVGAGAGLAVGNMICKVNDGANCLLARLAGAALGGYLGSKIGESLDEEDRLKLLAETTATLDNRLALSDGENVVPGSGFFAKNGAWVDVYESDAAGKPLTTKAAAKTKAAKAPKKVAKKAPVIQPAAAPQPEISMQPRFVQVGQSAPPPALGACKTITQRITQPGGQVVNEQIKYCKEAPAPGLWKPVTA